MIGIRLEAHPRAAMRAALGRLQQSDCTSGAVDAVERYAKAKLNDDLGLSVHRTPLRQQRQEAIPRIQRTMARH